MSDPASPGPRVRPADPGRPFEFLRGWPWEKIVIWSLFIGLLAALRSFFTIIFITFIMTYVLRNVVNRLCRFFRRPEDEGAFYRSSVVVVFMIFLALIVVAGRTIFPRLHAQASALVQRGLPLSPEDRLEGTLEVLLGPAQFETLSKQASYQVMIEGLRRGQVDSAALERGLRESLGDRTFDLLSKNLEFRATLGQIDGGPVAVPLEERLETVLRQLLGKRGFEALAANESYQNAVRSARRDLLERIPGLLRQLTGLLNRTLEFALDVLLSFIFGFIILLDLPRLRDGVVGLGRSRLGHVYGEIAPGLVAFGEVLGRAFQAQLLIALCNTILTLGGLLVIGVESPVLLSIVVFVFSFIPVFGAILSSIPIALVALQQPGGGFGLVLEVAGLVAVIHAVEAYILNPRILGGLLEIHPLVVLLILLVAERFFGVWGLLTGVPVAHYIFTSLVRAPAEARDRASTDPTEDAARERRTAIDA